MRGTNRFCRFVAPLAVALTLSATFSTFSTRALAGTPAQDLDAAEAAYADLDYEKANKLADSVVKQRGLTHDQLVRAYRIAGRTHAVLGHEAVASETIKLLLTYSPDEKSDASMPPKIQEAFAAARGFWAGYTTKPGLDVSTVLRAREPGTLRVTTRDPTHVAKKVVVGYRWGGSGNFTTANIAAGEGVTVEIPPSPPSTSRLDYYAQAVDERDDAVFESGNPGVPKTAIVDLSAPPQPPGGPGTGSGPAKSSSSSIFASPVFWVITGVVLAGAGTGIFFATRKAKDETLPPTGANLAPFLFCGGSSDGKCH